MLRSTGFFRGIDCPLYNGSTDGKSGCNRPYCHFRHSKSARRSSTSLYGFRGTKEEPAHSSDQGYDPFSPEVVRPGDQYNAENFSELSTGPVMRSEAMELELVNKAIEAVQSELEKSKKKLSQMGKQGYNPASRMNTSVKAGYRRQMASNPSSHSAYDPGSYQMGEAAEYNPTPCFGKYTLEPENGSGANSMEYVPTAISKPTVKKTPPTPAVTRVTRSLITRPAGSSLSKHKYTLDSLRPPTDMEYDPLSNFSAKPATKSGKNSLTGGKGRKRVNQSPDEEYVPIVKKPRQTPPLGDTPKYRATFESDDESSGNEYSPTPMRTLQRRSSAESVEADKRKSKGQMKGPKQQAAQETTMEDNESDNFQPLDSDEEPIEKKVVKNSRQIKSGQTEKLKKEGMASAKKTSSPKQKKASSSTEKTLKTSSQESEKKDKSHGKSSEGKVRTKERDSGKAGREGKEGKGKKLDKPKEKQSHKDKEQGISDAKKPKTDKVSQCGKESSKYKKLRNGKLESSNRETDQKKNGSSGKDRSKQSSSSLERKGGTAAKPKPRSLSHADLFGDESPEEEEDEDERIVRKSASAFKRGNLFSNKRKASDLTQSSSDDDNVCEYEGADDAGDDPVDFSTLQVDVDCDSDPMEECLRIFNESRYVKTEDKGRQAKQPTREKEDDHDEQSSLTTLFPGQKKRVSHFKAKGSTEVSLNALPQPQRRLTAQEMCYQRMQIAQQQAAQLAAAVKNTASGSSPFYSSSIAGEKRRVMHKPNPALVSAKPVLSDKQQTSRSVLSPTRAVPDQSSVKAHTSAAMLPKTFTTTTQKRVAHTPTLQSSSMKRPVIPVEFGAKVPTNVRQRYLTVFIDECLKFCPSEEVAFQMALDEEKLVYDRSSSKNIYLNVAVNTLKKLRSKAMEPPGPAPAPPSFKKATAFVKRKPQSHEGVLGGRLAAMTSYTVNRMGKQQEVELKGALLYQKLKAYVMTEEQLQEHSYPRPHPERSGHAIIFNEPEKKNSDPFSKVCCRCGADYKINANGSCVRKEECHHHWGRLRRYRVSRVWETQYSCCSGAVGSPGCQAAKQHVQDGRKESLDGYVKTFSKHLPADGNGGVFALDCEMCYTKQGLELTRVTVINSQLQVVYDTFVKPESKVVDYNTRFSGVTQEDLQNATIRLRDVQAVLLNMFSAESILIGHSLESDLFALKLLHSTVVDTAVVFPHRLGLPYKRALRNLMADHLKRIIQDNVEGHDSSEDAAACMELMIWKIKEDTKVKR